MDIIEFKTRLWPATLQKDLQDETDPSLSDGNTVGSQTRKSKLVSFVHPNFGVVSSFAIWGSNFGSSILKYG